MTTLKNQSLTIQQATHLPILAGVGGQIQQQIPISCPIPDVYRCLLALALSMVNLW